MNRNIANYYNERANEYDKVYQIPEEQHDLRKASELFQDIFKEKTVLEIACGTGYWTEQIARTAKFIYASDINQTVIDIALTRHYNDNVTFELIDLFNLKSERKCDGFFGGFIWSHILLEDLDKLLFKIKDLLIKNSTIVFIDSKPVEGTKHDKKNITSVDQFGNTFQTRKLENGTTHEVLKNFPSSDFLIQKLSQISTNIKTIELEYYWIVTCHLL